jgi:hypothetical protein
MQFRKEVIGMGWNMSNILVNEAIANKKSGGGGGEIEGRVSALEKTVSDLDTISSSNFDLVSAETEVGTFKGEKRYRRIVEFGPITPTVNTDTDIVLLEDNTIKDVIKIEGNFTTGNDQCQLPLVATLNSPWYSRVYYRGEDEDPNRAHRFYLQFKVHTTSVIKGFAILYYTKQAPTNNKRKGGKK